MQSEELPKLSAEDAKIMPPHRDVTQGRSLLSTWLGEYEVFGQGGERVWNGDIIQVRMNRRSVLYTHDYFIGKTVTQIVQEVKDRRFWPLTVATRDLLKDRKKLSTHLSSRRQDDQAIAYLYLNQVELRQQYPAVGDFFNKITNGEHIGLGGGVSFMTWTDVVCLAKRIYRHIRPDSLRVRKRKRFMERPANLSKKEWAKLLRCKERFRTNMAMAFLRLYLQHQGNLTVPVLREFTRAYVRFPPEMATPNRNWLVQRLSRALDCGETIAQPESEDEAQET